MFAVLADLSFQKVFRNRYHLPGDTGSPINPLDERLIDADQCSETLLGCATNSIAPSNQSWDFRLGPFDSVLPIALNFEAL